MKPDFPVVGHIHSFGVPTIYKVSGETCDCVELTSCQWRVLEEGIHRGERLQFKWKDEMKVRLSMISVIVLNLTTWSGRAQRQVRAGRSPHDRPGEPHHLHDQGADCHRDPGIHLGRVPGEYRRQPRPGEPLQGAGSDLQPRRELDL